MISKTNGKTNLLLFPAIFFFLLAVLFHTHSRKPTVQIKKQDSALNLNEHFITFFSLGHKRMISDLIWIQTLLESDMERYSNNDLGNWLYLRFLTISTLDPNFYQNYQYGGTFLSIIKDDLEGAADIFERGLKVFPEDYKLNYHAGFNYYYEMGEYEKGVRLLKKVENHPDANKLVKFLIRKIQFETDKDFAIPIAYLEMTLAGSVDENIKNKIKADLYSLKAERDLECLNKGGLNCLKRDNEGNKYIYKDSIWSASKPFNLYRIHRREFTRKRK